MSYIHQTYPNSTEFQSVKATNSYMISYNIIKYIYIYQRFIKVRDHQQQGIFDDPVTLPYPASATRQGGQKSERGLKAAT